MKNWICTICGIIGSAIASVFGGWTSGLTTLLIFMIIDYGTGLLVAGLFHNSPKTASGTLESNVGFKGLVRKCMILLFVLIGHRLDLALGLAYIKDAVVIAFMVNEALSIIENAGLMGIPIPSPITNAIEVLKGRQEEN